MAADGVNVLTASQQTPGDRLSPVEFWYGPGPELWSDHCGRDLGLCLGLFRTDNTGTTPRLVPGCRAQKWGQTGSPTAQAGGARLCCSAALLGGGLDGPDLPSSRPGPGRVDAGATRHDPLDQWGVRGGAIPVAWRVVAATQPGAWRPHGETLFGHLQGSVPAGWTVSVLADRGLYARWLLTTMQALGWHPFLRINRQGHSRLPASPSSRPLTQVVSRVGQRWAGQVICFTTPARQRTCTLLARWDAGYRDPWLILTALPPTAVDVAWYGLRAWIACGFKDSKRGGWHWEQTKMLAPARAARLWLALAVATLWTVSVGCQAEVEQPRPQVHQLPEHHIARKRATGQRPPRALSGFRRGRLVILAALCLSQPLPVGALRPEPWPRSPETAVDQRHASPPLIKAA